MMRSKQSVPQLERLILIAEMLRSDELTVGAIHDRLKDEGITVCYRTISRDLQSLIHLGFATFRKGPNREKLLMFTRGDWPLRFQNRFVSPVERRAREYRKLKGLSYA